ncbi:hypothetical protein [Rhizorhabdus argentea]|uniref:hypothetical protein n=1 Tax=Rhizorhabdus argentea TaxID=1387174 RepID=UPI0030EBD72E
MELLRSLTWMLRRAIALARRKTIAPEAGFDQTKLAFIRDISATTWVSRKRALWFLARCGLTRAALIIDLLLAQLAGAIIVNLGLATMTHEVGWRVFGFLAAMRIRISAAAALALRRLSGYPLADAIGMAFGAALSVSLDRLLARHKYLHEFERFNGTAPSRFRSIPSLEARSL